MKKRPSFRDYMNQADTENRDLLIGLILIIAAILLGWLFAAVS